MAQRYRYQPPKRSGLILPRKKTHWRLIIALILAATALLAPVLLINKHDRGAVNGSASSTQTTSTQSSTSSFDKTRFSLDDPTSLWVIANKQRALNPPSYVPADLTVPNITLKGARAAENMQVRAEAARALEAMATAAKSDGAELRLVSGYRSYNTQVGVYNSEVQAYGKSVADSESARPGHSEHQTGWAADLGAASGECDIDACFGTTTEGSWLAANAYKYGFIIRYPEGKQDVTGYVYEPWHVRYIGIDLATEMHNQNVLTLEEFFDLPAAPGY